MNTREELGRHQDQIDRLTALVERHQDFFTFIFKYIKNNDPDLHADEIEDVAESNSRVIPLPVSSKKTVKKPAKSSRNQAIEPQGAWLEPGELALFKHVVETLKLFGHIFYVLNAMTDDYKIHTAQLPFPNVLEMVEALEQTVAKCKGV